MDVGWMKKRRFYGKVFYDDGCDEEGGVVGFGVADGRVWRGVILRRRRCRRRMGICYRSEMAGTGG